MTWIQHTILRHVVLTLASVAGLTAGLLILQRVLLPADLLLCYVPLVLVVAIRFGRWAAALASLAAFLAYNFFFVPPFHTLTIEDPQDVLELGIFLVVSLVVGSLAARERMQMEAARRRAQQMSAFYQLSQEINAATDSASIVPAMATTARAVLGATAVEITLTGDNRQPARVTHIGDGAGEPVLRVPIMADGQTLGTISAWGVSEVMGARDEPIRLLTTLANLLVVTLKRAQATAEALHTEALREADRLKSALLSSVSHDLRTPLAVIKGAASNLLDASVNWDPATQRAFAATILAEADRLNRFMRNLLEMSRLEAGTLRRQRLPIEVGDVIVPTVQQLQAVLGDHPVHIDIAPDLPLVLVNDVQIELVLTNLVENAAKFAPATTPITVAARQVGAMVQISVADRGPGIPSDALDRIFDKFYRVAAPEQGPGGTGLGLSICQGIIEAHGGRIWAENRPDGGTIISFTVPIDAVSAPVVAPAAETTRPS